MAGRKTFTPGGGMFAMPVPGRPQPPRQTLSPVRQKAVEVLDRVIEGVDTENAIRAARAATTVPQTQGGTPPATSLTEMVTAMGKATEVHQGVASTALQLADIERDRRIEAEERSGGAYDAGKKSAEDQGKTTLDMFREFAGTTQSLLKETYEARIAAKDEEQKAILGRIEEQIKGALAVKDMEIARRDEKIAELEAQRNALAQRRTPQDLLWEAASSGNPRNHEFVKALQLITGAGDSMTPEEKANAKWMGAQADEKIEELADAREARRDARAIERAKGEKMLGLLDHLTQGAAELRAHLPRMLASAPRRPDSRVPTAWPQDAPPTEPQAQPEATPAAPYEDGSWEDGEA